ncbi:hypothetical protein TcCL_NonESM13101 [Trypanosoma cruzi]|nr:hypothetical protein TcCL_NonESM13101 [Trypanosoma cruzi]
MGGACLPASGRGRAGVVGGGHGGEGRGPTESLPPGLLFWNAVRGSAEKTAAAGRRPPYGDAFLATMEAGGSRTSGEPAGRGAVVALLLPRAEEQHEARAVFASYFAAAEGQRTRRAGENALGRRRGARV